MRSRSKRPIVVMLSGVVAAVAPEVRDAEIGDAVYGLTDFTRAFLYHKYAGDSCTYRSFNNSSLSH
jgi:hypothetical protein